jgi:ParB-like nuclease domain
LTNNTQRHHARQTNRHATNDPAESDTGASSPVDVSTVATASALEAQLIAEARRLHRQVGLKDTAIARRLNQTRHWVRKHVGSGLIEDRGGFPEPQSAAPAAVFTRLIAAIEVGERHRRDLGDIPALARSIAEVGLLHPIVVRSDGVLIAGERRLAACKSLGWETVPVTSIDIDKIAAE